jgi:hypothetical protein
MPCRLANLNPPNFTLIKSLAGRSHSAQKGYAVDKQLELKRLQRGIIKHLNELDQAEKDFARAEKAYDDALAEWVATHPELVNAKQEAMAKKVEARYQLSSLRVEAKNLLSGARIESLPFGFYQKSKKVVKVDKQGFLKQAHAYFPYLLVLDEAAVQDYFVMVAKPQPDGTWQIPEHIKVWASVEVVTEIEPEIDEAALLNLTYSPDEAWQPPANASGGLTSAGLAESFVDTKKLPELEDTDELPPLEDNSPAGESLPLHTWFWDDTQKGKKTELVPAYESVPPTDEIDF